MVCIYCGSPATKVTNSRPNKRSGQTWRRRQCQACGGIWSTYEAIDYATALAIQVSPGQLVPFNRDTLLVSLYKSCQHRPNPAVDASALVDTVLRALFTEHNAGMLTKQQIVSAANAVLQRFDTAAATHYQAFHS